MAEIKAFPTLKGKVYDSPELGCAPSDSILSVQ